MGNDLHVFINVLAVLCLIIIASQVMGRICSKFGQPRVLGEMIAGVLLGPTLFGMLAPNLHEFLFTSEVKSVLFMLSNLGLALYMFLVGAEVNFKEYNKRFYNTAFSLAISSFTVPLLTGIGVALLLQNQFSIEGNAFHFSLFVGVAFSMTAFPMLARILQEHNLVNTKIGSTTLLSASIIDVFGWLVLAVLIALVETNSVSGGLFTIASVTIFTLVMFVVGKPALQRLGNKVEKNGVLSQGDLALILVLVLAAAAVTDYIGVYSVFGGFILGLIMPKNVVFQNQLKEKLEGIVVVFLVPIFFTYSGINTHFTGLNKTVFLMFIIILVFSILSKYLSSLFVMKSSGYSWRDASAVGALMNARGLMELIVLNIGLSYGLLSQDMFTILVWMAIITTALAIPLYRLSYSDKANILAIISPYKHIKLRRDNQ